MRFGLFFARFSTSVAVVRRSVCSIWSHCFSLLMHFAIDNFPSSFFSVDVHGGAPHVLLVLLSCEIKIIIAHFLWNFLLSGSQ